MNRNQSFTRQFHTSTRKQDLMEFFDDPKNWGKVKVQVGRAWKIEELRIKSNTDLHKLWYVLLKEKNMLLTMEYACKEECRLFPNPERLDKVEISMENVEKVVKERNDAYHLLETGEKCERPYQLKRTILGIRAKSKLMEHAVPQLANPKYKPPPDVTQWDKDTVQFAKLYFEKHNRAWRFKVMRRRKYALALMKEMADTKIDREAFEERFPGVTYDQVKEDLDQVVCYPEEEKK